MQYTEVVAASTGVDLTLPGTVMNSHLPDVLGLPGVIARQRVTHGCHHAHLQLGEVGHIIVERHPAVTRQHLHPLAEK